MLFVLRYVVIKGWGEMFKAKYSLAVSFEAIDQDVPIYEPIRAEVEAQVETREIEIEIIIFIT